MVQSWVMVRKGFLRSLNQLYITFVLVVLSLAKMELDNFFKSVMPVADYFDQSDMLVAVSWN